MEFFQYLSHKYHICLNEQQRQAVEHKNGPALVLAGPGSGKTTVITARTAYLCLACGVKPHRILSITYSRASARDMGERFNRIYGKAIEEKVRFSTIHSFCYTVIRDYERRQGQSFRLIENETGLESKRAVLHRFFKQYSQHRANEDEMEKLISAIGLVKNKMLHDPAILECEINEFPSIFADYEAYKKEHILIDYDDMLTVSYKILRKCPDLLKKYQNWYPYVQVDEAQDASKIQFAIIRLLVGEKRNLFIVADDDQSIYGFRGAEPREILSVEQTYPGCKIFKLEKNYRSSRNIVQISSKFIRTNTARYDKQHQTDNPAAVDPILLQCDDTKAQWAYILDNIQRISKETPDSSFAILFRHNLSAVNLVDVLGRKQIPFNIRESDMFFFSHWVVEDVMAMLRFALDQTDTAAFERFYYKIGRYLSKQLVEYAVANSEGCESVIDAAVKFPMLKSFQSAKLKKLKDEFKGIARMPALNALRYMVSDFNYLNFVEDFCKKMRISFEGNAGFFYILCDVAEKCSTVPDFIDRLDQLQKMFLHRKRDPSARLTLSTFHSSKGLEFDTVFMVDLSNAEVPGKSIVENPVENVETMEEERRLWYVAMTRARKNLFMLYPLRARGVIQEPSTFLDETAKCMGIAPPASKRSDQQRLDILVPSLHKKTGVAMTPVGEGELIVHKQFGEGVVVKVTKERDLVLVDVKFRDQVKVLDWKICLAGNVVKCG